MAYRIYDLFNAKIGTTQVVGAESLELNNGFRVVASNNDGMAAVAARDKTYLYTEGRLGCQDIGGFGTLIALFEANESQSVLGEGKLAGDAAKSVRGTLLHAKLVRAGLSFQPGQHAKTNFDFRGSVDPASTTLDDELSIVEVSTKSITHAAGYRGVLVKSAVFTPSGGSAITPVGLTGLSLDIGYQVDAAAGSDDYGEQVEVSGGELTGTLGFVDATLTGAVTVGQRLIAAKYGVLVVTYTQQAGQADKTLTLSNLIFEEDRLGIAARKFHSNGLKFSAFAQASSTVFGIASGTNKLIAVA